MYLGKAIGMEESKHFSEKKFSVIQSSSFFESCFHTLQALKGNLNNYKMLSEYLT